MSTNRKITINAIANGIGLSCEAIISFCMLPYILHRLGDSAFGVWAFTISISGTMGILNLGFRPAINKYVAQYNATNEWQKIRDLLQASLFSYSICAIFIICICTYLSLNLSLLFNIPQEFVSIASTLVFLVGLQMATGLISVVFGGLISGLQRYELNNAIEIFVMLSRTTLIVFFLDRFPSLMTIAAAHFSMTIIGYLITVVVAYKIADIYPLKIFRFPEKYSIAAIFKFSAVIFVISTVGRLIMYIDAPLIAALLTASAVANYNIGSRLIVYLRNFVDVLISVITPAVSDFEARNKITTIENLFFFTSKLTSIVVFPVLIFLVYFGNEFIFLWLGKSYVESYQVMIVLAISSFFHLPQLSTGSILYGTARHEILMYFSILSGILSVVLAIFLTEKFGLVGLAIGLSFPQALLFGIGSPIYVSRFINFSLFQWVVVAYVKPLCIAIPYGLILLIIKNSVFVDTWIKITVVFCAGQIICMLFAWLVILSESERKGFLGVFGIKN